MTSHAIARHIEHWPPDKLIPYARNPRTHSDAQVAQIAASISEFGFNNPILVARPAARRSQAPTSASPGDRPRPPQRNAEARLHSGG